MSKKIQDNESTEPLLQLSKFIEIGLNTINKIPFVYKFKPELKKHRDEAMDIVKASNILTLPDQFNDFFSKEGWVCYGGLNLDVLKKSVYLASSNKYLEAKDLLINYVDEEFINLIIKKCKNREHFKDRLTLLNLLEKDYLDDRYYACIPLLLALIDGLANDISKHVGFFAENSDLELYDSITSHETGLPFLKLIMNKSRTKTTTEEIFIPFRNGILHGRDLNFANKEVASKCWWVLACLIEWADEKVINKQPKKPESLNETFKKYLVAQENSRKIGAWKKRPTKPKSFWEQQTLDSLDPNSPEYTLLVFLSAWKEKQWGKMTPLLLHNIGKHLGKASGQVSSDYSQTPITAFKVKNSVDQTPASTKILTHITFIKNDTVQSRILDINLSYANSNSGLPELRG